MKEKGDVVFYQEESDSTRIEVKLENDSVWLNINQMAELFGRDKSVISRHLSNVFNEGELKWEATVAKNATVQIEGNREVNRDVEYYNLDVIISIGYRVNSQRGTQFRIWANKVLRDYLIRGRWRPFIRLLAERICIRVWKKRLLTCCISLSKTILFRMGIRG